MSPSPEKRMEELFKKLRTLKGFGHMTSKQAEAEFAAATPEDLSDSEIASIVESVMSGELTSWEPSPDLEWADELDLEDVECDALQIYRNKGEDDAEASAAEQDLREELLDDGDDTEEEDGMDGGSTPP